MSVSSCRSTSPARNLTHAFEALCVDVHADEDLDVHNDDSDTLDTDLDGPATDVNGEPADPTVSSLHSSSSSSSSFLKGKSKSNIKLHLNPLISPTGVADVHMHETASCSNTARGNNNDNDNALSVSLAGASDASDSPTGFAMPHLELHPDLKRDLSQALVNRVSFYGIIHDINKEVTAMLSNDCASTSVESSTLDDSSPLVMATTNGNPPIRSNKSNPSLDDVQVDAMKVALVDEEEWLLSTIACREPSAEKRACPKTFLQAMGEKEYENPVASLAGSTRTQLWKPSRSWWEAKSGKNPWIEPTSHNKRWRYLWPLIHYHKFLAKCIKKLKRYSVDVKQSVSPVAVFLREEVCAVSDHLAALSLFDSDHWMACLTHFHGWTDPSAEDQYRSAVAKLKLRQFHEPGDVDSLLLRNQIDEQFLRTMAAARDQLKEATSSGGKGGQPPMYPKSSPVPKHIQPKNSDQRRARVYPSYPQQMAHQQSMYYPAPQQIQQPQWNQQVQVPPGYCDNSSVQSAITTDSGANHQATQHVSQQQPPALTQPVVAQQQPAQAIPQLPHMYHHPAAAPYYHYNGSDLGPMSGYPHVLPQHAAYDHHQAAAAAAMQGASWGMDPSSMAAAAFYAMQQQFEQQQQQTNAVSYYNAMLSSPQSTNHIEAEGDGAAHDSTTPQGKSPMDMPSPYWSHLDQATLAMGLATPAKVTPCRDAATKEVATTATTTDASFCHGAQPLFLQGHYYGNGGYHEAASGMYGVREGYGPPSPATQFLMSPQANFYNYGYGAMSSPPRKMSSHKSPRKQQQKQLVVDVGVSPKPLKTCPEQKDERSSPSTVETLAETESLHAS